MKTGNIQYKTALFINSVLENQLTKCRNRLLECQKDNNCPQESYENQLDFCNKVEYAIKEMEKFI
tara:strand:+ start:75 stop:269 length:195 start_codon:yes stop_codon:yes gene_type:complete